ncbi:MAG: GntR family transcriptional regulator [Actinomycetota bacterium]|nr:GntR family transcriptional regulator [Actinomycetota bacterium]
MSKTNCGCVPQRDGEPAINDLPTESPYTSLQVGYSSTVERVAEELRRALFEGELAPGTPLREIALAEQIGVSRSTIREALGSLVAEGLASRAPNRGVTVNELNPDDVRDVCRARVALEVAGVRRWDLAAESQHDAVRAALADFTRVAGSRADTSTLTAAHLAIHRALVGLTGSDRLLAVADGLGAEVRLALAHVDRMRRNAREQVVSHRDLVLLLEAGQIEAAVAELEHHLAGAQRSMLEAIHEPPRRRDAPS